MKALPIAFPAVDSPVPPAIEAYIYKELLLVSLEILGDAQKSLERQTRVIADQREQSVHS